MSEKKPNKLVIAIMALLFVVRLANYLILDKRGSGSTGSIVAYETEMSKKGTEGAEPTPEPVAEGQPSVTDEAAIASTASGLVDVNAALGDRILGDVNAPLKISEHASLTCSHCGHFHKETFPELKKNFIDTGKAYLVFSDFPLNEPAMRATLVARCLPEDKFFDFIGSLFEKQEEWAYEPDTYKDWLKKAAAEKGMAEDKFEACFNSKELEEGIQARMKGVQEQWKISSTPSFVINNTTVLNGAMKYEDFEKALNEELSKAQAGSQPPAADSTPSDETPPQE